ncbi:hypothetical protein CPT_Seuss105 [Caulobacter phage Seuss]|uniref:Uncharacterized protein n=1 Tax=Caulobacter phage Seuss TaxID=1675601 RepID=A0A0K1LM96_9CAUD|nr:hypothetical protein HOR08_gp105 [Caulobacter phage Seuss]AKU43631.1 hypothetical protein CPT_Seuss105 [Caulobacter phage Seuss]
MIPLTLNVRDVAQAALKAHSEKRLSAQNESPACMYRDHTGHPCAVGAALDNETAHDLDKIVLSDIPRLIASGRLKTDEPDQLAALQRLHDEWAQARRDGHAQGVIDAKEKIFIDFVKEILK